MSAVQVYGGDFLPGPASYMLGILTLKTHEHWIIGESIAISRIVSVEIVAQETHKSIASSVGRAAVGGLMLGGAGLVAGAIMGKSKSNITFSAMFDDGRRLLASSDMPVVQKLLAAAMANCAMKKPQAPQIRESQDQMRSEPPLNAAQEQLSREELKSVEPELSSARTMAAISSSPKRSVFGQRRG